MVDTNLCVGRLWWAEWRPRYPHNLPVVNIAQPVISHCIGDLSLNAALLFGLHCCPPVPMVLTISKSSSLYWWSLARSEVRWVAGPACPPCRAARILSAAIASLGAVTWIQALPSQNPAANRTNLVRLQQLAVRHVEVEPSVAWLVGRFPLCAATPHHTYGGTTPRPHFHCCSRVVSHRRPAPPIPHCSNQHLKHPHLMCHVSQTRSYLALLLHSLSSKVTAEYEPDQTRPGQARPG